jgi:uncharacterized cupredoxin-like copper-binding protein
MKQIALLTLLVLFGLFGTACGTTATAVLSTQPAQTLAAAASPAASGVTSATQVEVTLADNTITSSTTDFKPGVTYTFVIKNAGQRAHSFSINQPVSDTGSLDASLAGALLTVPQQQLPIGGGTTVEYTFPDSAVGMTLEFSCLIKRHYDDNMRLAITVTR